jgi:RNA polymerase sigma factor (TIGR02999 family)
MSDATQLLTAIEQGEPQAAEKLLDLVYEELRRLAAIKMAIQVPGHTLQPTALVHEAWLRLVGDRNPTFKDRAHFFRAAAEAMRHILIDRVRRKQWRNLIWRLNRLMISSWRWMKPWKNLAGRIPSRPTW